MKPLILLKLIQYTIFTELNEAVIIFLVIKINAMTIQTLPPLTTHKQYLCRCFYDQLWAYSHAVTIRGVVFNQVNMVIIYVLCQL